MSHEPRSPHDEAAEREWALQEQAVKAERLGLDPTDNATVLRYRALARMLRQPLDETLPLDFADQVAAKARRHSAFNMRLELCLSLILLGVLAAMLVALTALYGQEWLQLIRAALPTHALMNPWLLLLTICVVLSGALDRLIPAQGSTTR
jgi:anti-sigma factor RsiW